MGRFMKVAKGPAIWPEQEGTSHPFIHRAIMDDQLWFLSSSYIEWHKRGDDMKPKLMRSTVVSRSGPTPIYAWVSVSDASNDVLM